MILLPTCHIASQKKPSTCREFRESLQDTDLALAAASSAAGQAAVEFAALKHGQDKWVMQVEVGFA